MRQGWTALVGLVVPFLVWSGDILAQDRADPSLRATRSEPRASLWTHDGSLVKLMSSGNERRFLYEQPRPELRTSGVTRGTLLFVGRRVGDRLAGSAYVFSAGCAPAPYKVAGTISSEAQFELSGHAPTRASASCRILGYGPGAPSKLTFTYLRIADDERTGTTPVAQSAPDPTSRPAESPPAPVGRTDQNHEQNGQGLPNAYLHLVAEHLARQKKYPEDARLRREQGTAMVAFTIDGGGKVMTVSVDRGSGLTSIDEEAQAMVRRASPFPAPPSNSRASFTVPIRFDLAEVQPNEPPAKTSRNAQNVPATNEPVLRLVLFLLLLGVPAASIYLIPGLIARRRHRT